MIVSVDFLNTFFLCYFLQCFSNLLNCCFLVKLICWCLLLLILHRALEFFCAFMSLLVSEYRDGSLEDSLHNAVYLAYDQSLSRHHNWFMRGTFYVSFLLYISFLLHTLDYALSSCHA